MASIEELMRGNLLEVFNERDGARRRAAIARIYAPDVRFADPDETVTGHDALDAKAQGILDGAPGLEFQPDGPIRVSDDLGYLAWTFGPVKGMDIATVANGVITRLYTFLT